MSDVFSHLTEDQIIERALAILEQRAIKGEALTSPQTVKDLARLKIGALEHEVFAIFYLSTAHALIDFQILFRGTIDGASVYPREVIKEALARNAAALIFCHNHPSGSTLPSEADRNITDRLVKAARLIDIRVLDHIIVSERGVQSFAELGYI